MYHYEKCNTKDDKIMFTYPLKNTRTSPNRMDITDHDLQTLAPGNYLNDRVIQLYFNMMVMKERANSKIHIMDTLFFTMLSRKGVVSQIDKMLKVEELVQKELIIIPVNQKQFHWTLMLIVRPDKIANAFKRTGFQRGRPHTHIIRLDSQVDDTTSGSITVNDIHSFAHGLLLKWLNHLVRHQKTIVMTLQKKHVPLMRPDVPQQNNGYDCGVYCLKFVQIIYKQFDLYTNLTDKDSPHVENHIIVKGYKF